MITTLIIACVGLMLTIVCLFGWMFSYYALLKTIKASYPKYYKKIGDPFFPKANFKMLGMINRDVANYRFMVKILNGLPTSFPKDKQCQKLARATRRWIAASAALVIIDLVFLIIAVA